MYNQQHSPESFLEGSIDCAELITDTGAEPDVVWLTISLLSSLPVAVALLVLGCTVDTAGFLSTSFVTGLLSLAKAGCTGTLVVEVVLLLVLLITLSMMALLVSLVEVDVPDAILMNTSVQSSPCNKLLVQ